ncbi:MAG: hypothetical protein Kow0092_19970 [Deferrisomatales bacterium]
MPSTTRPAVLLIDDDPDILKLMELVFEDAGMNLVTCRSPEEGLRILAEREISCVVIDIHFAHTPGCLGFLTAKRSLEGKREIPVLATSAMTGQEVVRQVLDLGARKFIPKPFYPREILREIRAVCP